MNKVIDLYLPAKNDGKPSFFVLKVLPPGENPAEAFAKGGDSRSMLEVSSFRLRTYNNREVILYNLSFVIKY
jgi:hypothetical protein